ncbi:MAG: response regulator [Bacillota bacterium]|nr:response regulator [Bacillota bacterium]
MYTALIADDEIVIREGLRDLFDWAAYGVTVIAEADDGEKAYQLVQELSPDIIVTDIVMPRLNGLDMVSRLRDNGNMSEIILISAYQDVQYFKHAFKINAVDYILKPIDMAEFASVLDQTVYKLRLARGEIDLKADERQSELEIQNVRKVIRDICTYIDSNLGKKLTIACLAKKCYVSENYLCLLFRQETGKTINSYITQQRMQRAREMLASSPMYINEVAHAVGYMDANYFSRQFKKFYGVTPYDFKEML